MRPFIKDVADIITVDTKKAMLEDDPYVNLSLCNWYIENTAGNYFFDIDVISLSYGKFTKELCEKKNESIELQTCKTISHEIVHRVIFEQTNIKVCAAFDNIAEKLEPYGVW